MGWRILCINGKSSMTALTTDSLAATNSNEHCIEPLPLTPPRGILMHERTCAQNCSLSGANRTTVSEERSANAYSRSIMLPRVWVVASLVCERAAGVLCCSPRPSLARSRSELS